ncbi:MAG: pyridine nucleotide-disulfide oxidoreductase, partial [bacterium]
MGEDREHIVILGSGAAGLPVASQIRRETKDIDLTVVTKADRIAYSPCAIPFVLDGKIEDF